MKRTALILSLLLILILPLVAYSQSMNIGLARAATSDIRHQPLAAAQLHGPRMQLLEQRTGLSEAQIVKLYDDSGARYFGQFTCALLTADRLGVDRAALLAQLNKGSIYDDLVRMGVDPQRSRKAIRESLGEMVAVRKSAS